MYPWDVFFYHLPLHLANTIRFSKKLANLQLRYNMPMVQQDLPIATSAFEDMYGLTSSTSEPSHSTKKPSKSSSFSLSRMLRKGQQTSSKASSSKTSPSEPSSSPRLSTDSEVTLAVTSPTTSQSPEKLEKNYEEAFGALSSWYGVSGSVVPAPSPSEQKNKTESKTKSKSKTQKESSDPHSAALRVWSLYKA